MIAIVCLLLLNLTAQDLKVAIFNPSSSGKVSSRASKALLNTLKKEINSISVYNVVESINEIGKIIKELEISLNDCSENCFNKLKRNLDIDIIIIGHIKRSGDNFSFDVKIFNINNFKIKRLKIGPYGGVTKLINQISMDIEKYLVGYKEEIIAVGSTIIKENKETKNFKDEMTKEKNCDDAEVKLWDNCYSINDTDSLSLKGRELEKKLIGEIPTSIGQLKNLKYLNLSGNRLTGEIPTSIGQLKNLKYLNLSFNRLVASIPKELKNLSNLETLLLRQNQLEGEFSYIIDDMISLNKLDLEQNKWYHCMPLFMDPKCGDFTRLDTINTNIIKNWDGTFLLNRNSNKNKYGLINGTFIEWYSENKMKSEVVIDHGI